MNITHDKCCHKNDNKFSQNILLHHESVIAQYFCSNIHTWWGHAALQKCVFVKSRWPRQLGKLNQATQNSTDKLFEFNKFRKQLDSKDFKADNLNFGASVLLSLYFSVLFSRLPPKKPHFNLVDIIWGEWCGFHLLAFPAGAAWTLFRCKDLSIHVSLCNKKKREGRWNY